MTTSGKKSIFVPLALAVALAAGACGRSTAATSQPANGVLTGRLIIEGGPSQDSQPRPLTGTVSFIQHARVVATAATAADGTFAQTLAAGDYQVRACTSKIETVEPDGSHVDACATGIPATVSADHTTVVDIPDFIVP